MKKARLIAGVTAVIPAAVGGFAVPTAAHAAQATTAAAQQVKGKTVLHAGIQRRTSGPGWYSISAPETLYFRNGGSFPHYLGMGIYVTCYYTGAPGSDPYWDHFTKYIVPPRGGGVVTSRAGHVADAHVDMNGRIPPNNGIPH
jgi:hypothetical protein